MAGTDSQITLAPDSTGKLVDCDSLTTGVGTVQRERNRVAGAGAAELADVRNAVPGTSDYGVATREVPKSLKPFNVSVNGAGDNTIVAAVGGKRLKVYWFEIIGTDSTQESDVTWKSGAGTTLIGPRHVSPMGVWEKQAVDAPNFILATNAGDALVLNLGTGVAHRVIGGYWDDDAS